MIRDFRPGARLVISTLTMPRPSQAIRGMLGSKYGKEYIAEASSDTYCRKWVVNENLIRCGSYRDCGTLEQMLGNAADCWSMRVVLLYSGKQYTASMLEQRSTSVCWVSTVASACLSWDALLQNGIHILANTPVMLV